MNIIVAMKQIPDLQQIRIRDRKPVCDDVPKTFGNLDKNALEAAVVLKEKVNGKVIVISAGTEELEDTIKEALAGGADEALIVADNKLENSDSAENAQILAAMIRSIDNPRMILMGEGSGDNYSGQVGSRVAEILDLPQVGYASGINIMGDVAEVTRSLEDCEELLAVELPAVITVVAGINEPRIPSVIQILKAGKKPKEIIERDVIAPQKTSPKVSTLSNLAPEMERKRITVKTVEELLAALQSEGFIRR